MRVVKQRIAAHLGLENQAPPNFGLSTTLNMDECIARGCALQSAILSPLFRVKEFNVIDRVLYSVRLSWEEAASGMEVEDDEEGGADDTLVIFKAGEDTPKLRRVTFRRTEGALSPQLHGLAPPCSAGRGPQRAQQPFTVTASHENTSLLLEGVSEELRTLRCAGNPLSAKEGEEVPGIPLQLRQDNLREMLTLAQP
jgi:Hsp70 protein.